MEGFTLKGENNNHISISIERVFGFPEKTCHAGGYEVVGALDIKSGNFIVKSYFTTSTGEFFKLYEQLRNANDSIKGKSNYTSTERELDLEITYDKLGHVNIKGLYIENLPYRNELTFEFQTDQSFIPQTVNELEQLANKYGGMKGIKN